MKNKLSAFLTLASLAILHSPLSTLNAQGTAFTYQGRLNDGVNPASGIYDLQFTIYDAASGPTQQGATLTNATTAVSNGQFTVTLDFGNQFPGANRWLEIGVRTNGGGAFTLLAPRQQLTATPYSTYALSAGSASTASNVTSGAVVSSVNALKDNVVLQAGTNVTITPSGNTLTIASAGAGGSGIWNLNGTNAYFTSGKVGIGTNAPNHRLRISGGPAWTANGWAGALELDNASAIGWRPNAGGQSYGIGPTTGGLYFFHTLSSPGTTASGANYDMEITDSGNLLVGGGSDNGNKLQVNGPAFFASTGSGGNVAVGSPNAESGLTITGSARADIRFDGSTLKLLAGPAGSPPSSANGVAITTSGNVGIGTTTPNAKLQVTTAFAAIRGTSTGNGNAGVWGESTGDGGEGVYGEASGAGQGVHARSVNGTTVYAESLGSGTALYASSLGGLAGVFNGNVQIGGTLSKSGGSFKIDHPLAPANKYLYHSFVESPDMMNVYNGNAILDDAGEATVQMPEWFESLNKDFRYQLTSIGAPGPNLYVAEEVAGNHFKIAGGSAGAKVSWQVTGIRQDAWANAHRIKVEEDKPESERGTYLHPELFGASTDKAVFKVQH